MAASKAGARKKNAIAREDVVERRTQTRGWSLIEWLRGTQTRRLIGRLFILVLLTDVAFIFVVPILRLVSTSLMDVMDLYDPTVVWLPRRWAFENYTRAFQALEYMLSFRNSILVTGVSAVLQTLACALAGYGFARFKFPGRDKLFLLVLFVMIVPPHAIIIQMFILVSRLSWLETYWPFIVPSAFGMGLRGALFVFIYRQFFKGMPWELEDAAMIDGAGPLRIFLNVMLPLAQPAILVVFLFSFVWHWNDSLEPSIYLSRPEYFFLPQRLSVVESALSNLQLRGMWGTGTIMAATLLVILPLLILYIFTQRYFVESIERTGLID
jgi:multiple sugar transport system permease protein